MGLPATARESGGRRGVIDAEWSEVRPRLRDYLRVVYKYRWLCVRVPSARDSWPASWSRC